MKIIKFGIVVSIFYYLFYNFDFNKISVDVFNIYGVCFTIFTILFSQILLSIRWQKMTSLSFVISLETTIVSSFFNMVLPAKMGEVSKLVYLKKFYNVAINKISAVVFVERLFDILILGIIMLIYLYLYFQNQNIKVGAITVMAFLFINIVIFKLPFFIKLLKKIPFKFIRVYSQKFYKNINSLLRSPYEILLWTLLVWCSYFLATFVFYFYAVDFDLTFMEIIELFLFSSIALSISITPGGIATYEAIMVIILAKYGIDKENAIIVSSLFHFCLYLVDFIMFGIFLISKDIKYKELIR